jgi:hypothetical protein
LIFLTAAVSLAAAISATVSFSTEILTAFAVSHLFFTAALEVVVLSKVTTFLSLPAPAIFLFATSCRPSVLWVPILLLASPVSFAFVSFVVSWHYVISWVKF